MRIHAALIVSPRDTASMPKPAAPSVAIAIQRIAKKTLFIGRREFYCFRGPERAALLGGRNLVLLELPIRHRERGQAQRLRAALDPERPRHHAAPQRLVGLCEFLWHAERTKSFGKVAKREVMEIGV